MPIGVPNTKILCGMRNFGNHCAVATKIEIAQRRTLLNPYLRRNISGSPSITDLIKNE